MAQDPLVEVYALYTAEYGYPPKQPKHLIAYAKKSGLKVPILNWVFSSFCIGRF